MQSTGEVKRRPEPLTADSTEAKIARFNSNVDFGREDGELRADSIFVATSSVCIMPNQSSGNDFYLSFSVVYAFKSGSQSGLSLQ